MSCAAPSPAVAANQKNTVLLLRAAPEWRGELEFSFEDKDRQIAVTVAPCATVLAVLDALAATGETVSTWSSSPPATPARSGTPCSPSRCIRRSSRSTAGIWSRTRSARVSLDPALDEEGQPLGRRGAARRAARGRLAAAARTGTQPGQRAEPADRHPSRDRGRRRLPGRRRRPAPVDDRPRGRRDLPPAPRGRTHRAYRLAGGDHGRRRGRGLRDGRDRQDLRRRPLRPRGRRAVRAAGARAGRAPRTRERNGRGVRRPRPRGGALPRRHVP